MEQLISYLKVEIAKSNASRRIFHGRGKQFPTYDYFNIDLYWPYIVIIFYREYQPEILSQIVQLFTSSDELELKGIIVQKRFLLKSPSETIWGEVPTEANILIEENLFALKFLQSQNLGFFLDMKLGRNFLKLNSADKKVLNLFSYTCALSVVALKNGAARVDNYDMSKGAIARGIQNHKINNLDLNKVKFFAHDIFKSLGKIERNGPYDLIIIDPPLDHGDHFKVDRDYLKLITRSNLWLKSGGILFTALNSPHHDSQFLINMVKNSNANFKLNEVIGLPSEYCEMNSESGLKILIWEKL
jgi:23S rRNA (cytosine1962-C5)-methyltransferase